MKSPREAIKQAMQKLPKDDPRVEYSSGRGRKDHHCGPDERWPKGYCEYFYQDSVNDGRSTGMCKKVSGSISTMGGCLLYEKAKDA